MKTKNVTEKNMKVCLVGSSGGHLTHLYMLKPFWKDKNHFWVTFDKEDARSLLEGEKMYVFILPSRFEGLPMCALEAQVNGLYASISNSKPQNHFRGNFRKRTAGEIGD